MTDSEKKRVPLIRGLWEDAPHTGESPHLIGSKCKECGEIFFPKKEKGWCVYCMKEGLEDITLSTRGKIHTASVVMQQPGGGFYHGPVPYAYGFVNLPEGVRVETLFTSAEADELEVGRDAELLIDRLCDDEDGNEVVTFMFRPV